MPSCFLDVLRRIIFCGEDERQHSRYHPSPRNAGASSSVDRNCTDHHPLLPPSNPPFASPRPSQSYPIQSKGYAAELKEEGNRLFHSQGYSTRNPSPSCYSLSKPAQSPLPPPSTPSPSSSASSNHPPSSLSSSKPLQSSSIPPSKPSPSTPSPSSSASSDPSPSSLLSSRNAGASSSVDRNRTDHHPLLPPSNPPPHPLASPRPSQPSPSRSPDGNYAGYSSSLPPSSNPSPIQSEGRAAELKEEGNRMFHSKDYVAALACYDRALRLLPLDSPGRAVFHSNRAACLMQQQPVSYHAVVAECSLALQAQPNIPRALHRRAQALHALRRYGPALKDLQALLSVDPTNRDAIDLARKIRESSATAAAQQQQPSPSSSNPSPSSLLSSKTPQSSAPISPSYSPKPTIGPSSRTEKRQSWQVVQSKTPQSPSYPTSSPETTLVSSSSTCQRERIPAGPAVQRYEIPKHLEEQFKNDIVPEILMRPLSPSTYADYFATLLHAEDFYFEKWSGFILSKVTLELQMRKLYETRSRGNKGDAIILVEKKPFVSFEIDAIPERRPYLLSRDFVFLKLSHKATKPFKGVIFRVVKSRMVLVDFGDDFHSQHSSSNKYDVSFSFNRVCLKRAHQAIAAATMDSALHDVLFPYVNPIASSSGYCSIASRILHYSGHIPYLIEGPLAVTFDKLSATGTVIQQAILEIYEESPGCRILVCAPTNRACDALMRSVRDKIPRAKLFRANAAFREYDFVPDDIIPESSYEGECFTCPSLCELQKFKVITSTNVSSFRLHSAGVKADHFTHVFLVDASSAMEPDVVIPLSSFVGKDTVVVVTGSSGDSPKWVRSDIARKHGLKRSYFERLLRREPYVSRQPEFITHIKHDVTGGSRVSMLSRLQRSEHYMPEL